MNPANRTELPHNSARPDSVYTCFSGVAEQFAIAEAKLRAWSSVDGDESNDDSYDEDFLPANEPTTQSTGTAIVFTSSAAALLFYLSLFCLLTHPCISPVFGSFCFFFPLYRTFIEP